MSGCGTDDGCGCESPGLTRFEDALENLLSYAKSVHKSRKVPLNQALGRVLAEDQRSVVNVPPNDNSAMDGYAVNVADLTGTEHCQLPVNQRIPAGADPDSLTPGNAARIFTGAKIPQGANAVIKQEDCEALDGAVRLPVNVKEGQNIRLLGQDILIDDTIMSAGTRLQPHHLGVLASVGIAEVAIYQPLKIAVLSTGDELVEPGMSLAPGQIYNSNRYTLTGLVQGLGMELVDLGIVADTLEATEEALLKAAQEADVIVSSGGVSVGEEDHVKAAVEKLGSLNLWRMAIKPGKPFAYGDVQGKPFLGLPGNPAAVLVSFNILARPYLLKMQGANEIFPISYRAPIKLKRKSQIRKEFMRARMVHEQGQVRIEPYSNQSSGVLSSAVWANGYAVIPAHTELCEGDEVEFVSFAEVMH